MRALPATLAPVPPWTSLAPARLDGVPTSHRLDVWSGPKLSAHDLPDDGAPRIRVHQRDSLSYALEVSPSEPGRRLDLCLTLRHEKEVWTTRPGETRREFAAFEGLLRATGTIWTEGPGVGVQRRLSLSPVTWTGVLPRAGEIEDWICGFLTDGRLLEDVVADELGSRARLVFDELVATCPLGRDRSG